MVKTTYFCDRCLKECKVIRHVISLHDMLTDEYKHYDLCPRCFKVMQAQLSPNEA